MHLRPILYVTGLMTLGLGMMMLPCVLVDKLAGVGDWRIFFLLSITSIAIGGTLAISTRQEDMPITSHDAFVLTVLIWGVIVLVAAAPFFLGFRMSFTDSVFESMSGLTTTGATVMTGLETYPPSILLWRGITQWIGGIGIIVTAIAILPSMKVGGMQLFHMESSDTQDKFLPRIGAIATQTALVYIGLTAICAGLYRMTGLDEFDAIVLSLTTLATGGFANSDASFGPYVEHGADYVAIIFMTLGSLPFTLMVMAMHGNIRAMLRDPQPWVWISFAAIATFILSVYIQVMPDVEIGPEGPVRMAAFNVISILSGTGYSTQDFGLWGPLASTLFILLMFLGGTAGSASCGLKTFRVHIAFLAMIAYTKNMIRPNRVSPVRYAGRVVKQETLQSIMLFMFLFFATFAVLASGLALTGLDPETAISAAAATICNVGPGLGETVGPAGHYQSLPPVAKWLCIIAMLLGRLELISVFVIMSPGFWRN